VRRLLTIILVILAAGSCAKNPFSAREGEEPTAQAGTFIPPTSPQIVLENLRLSYMELVIGNFNQSIDSQFVFRFDFIEGLKADTGWGFRQEMSLTENLFADFNVNRSSRSLRINLSFQDGQVDEILDTTAPLVRRYDLVVVDSLGDQIESYQGIGRFEMVESAFNFWALRAWEDIHLDIETRSWADLKNAYH